MLRAIAAIALAAAMMAALAACTASPGEKVDATEAGGTTGTTATTSTTATTGEPNDTTNSISANENSNGYNEILAAYIEDESVREAFLSVLLGESDFYGEENLPFLWEPSERDRETRETRYNIKTFWDGMVWNGDGRQFEFNHFFIIHTNGIPMIIIMNNIMGSVGSLFLYHYDGNIYGSQELMSFHSLSENGIMHWLDSETDEEPILIERMSQIKLNQDKLEINHLAHVFGTNIPSLYQPYIGNTPVTMEDYKIFTNVYKNSPAVMYDFYLN